MATVGISVPITLESGSEVEQQDLMIIGTKSITFWRWTMNFGELVLHEYSELEIFPWFFEKFATSTFFLYFFGGFCWFSNPSNILMNSITKNLSSKNVILCGRLSQRPGAAGNFPWACGIVLNEYFLVRSRTLLGVAAMVELQTRVQEYFCLWDDSRNAQVEDNNLCHLPAVTGLMLYLMQVRCWFSANGWCADCIENKTKWRGIIRDFELLMSCSFSIANGISTVCEATLTVYPSHWMVWDPQDETHTISISDLPRQFRVINHGALQYSQLLHCFYSLWYSQLLHCFYSMWYSQLLHCFYSMWYSIL